MVLALVDAKTALDLFLVAAVAVALLALWCWTDKREKRRRVERKEKLASYKLDCLRREKAYEAAQRYHGIGVR